MKVNVCDVCGKDDDRVKTIHENAQSDGIKHICHDCESEMQPIIQEASEEPCRKWLIARKSQMKEHPVRWHPDLDRMIRG